MNRRDFLKATSAVGVLCRAGAALPLGYRGGLEGDLKSYRPGDRVDPEVFFLDSKLRRVALGAQVNELTRVVYLLIFGGAYARKPPDKRGGLWCADTVDDMSVHRALYYNYADKGVTFVPVATPPVYESARYGYAENVFLTEREDAPAYRKAVETFAAKTEALKEDGSLPFDPIFYDPRFRLLDNPYEHEHVPAYGRVYPWQGRFKWHEDEQRYGTPTLWLLDRDLTVLRPPFYGNNYEAVPLHINYTVRDVEKALDKALQ